MRHGCNYNSQQSEKNMQMDSLITFYFMYGYGSLKQRITCLINWFRSYNKIASKGCAGGLKIFFKYLKVRTKLTNLSKSIVLFFSSKYCLTSNTMEPLPDLTGPSSVHAEKSNLTLMWAHLHISLKLTTSTISLQTYVWVVYIWLKNNQHMNFGLVTFRHTYYTYKKRCIRPIVQIHRWAQKW